MNGYKRESDEAPALKELLVQEENDGVNSNTWKRIIVMNDEGPPSFAHWQ